MLLMFARMLGTEDEAFSIYSSFTRTHKIIVLLYILQGKTASNSLITSNLRISIYILAMDYNILSLEYRLTSIYSSVTRDAQKYYIALRSIEE